MIALIVLTILYFTVSMSQLRNPETHRGQSNARQSNQDFYDRTVAAMEAREKAKPAAPPVVDQGANEKPKEASNVAKEAVEPQGQRTPPEVVLDNGDKGVAGRKKLKGGEKWDVSSGKEAGTTQKEEVKKTDEEKDVEMELNSILKRSPSESLSSHI